MQEIISKRTYTSKDHTNGDGTNTLLAHSGHIHYQNVSGDLVDVDLSFADNTTYWAMTKASYRLFVNKVFGSAQLIRFDNRYEGANHSIYYTPHSLWWVNADDMSQRTKIADAQAVSGVVIGQVIRYADAFGTDIHFEVTIQRHGVRKALVADNKAAFGVPPYANYYVVPVVKWEATGLNIRRIGNPSDWDQNSYYEHSGQFEVRDASGYKSYIRRARGIDADGDGKFLKVFFEKRDGILWQGKLISKALVQNAVFPVRADAVTDFDPTAGDGFVSNTEAADWNTAHNAATGDFNDDTDVAVAIQTRNNWTDARGFIPIDTTALDDAAIISAAELQLYGNETNNSDSDDMGIVQTSQASTASLGNADYDQCGSTHGATEGMAVRIALSAVGATQYHVFLLDATGRGWIDPTGISKFGIRLGTSLDDIATSGRNRFSFSTGEAGANEPFLRVTYTVPGVGVVPQIQFLRMHTL